MLEYTFPIWETFTAKMYMPLSKLGCAILFTVINKHLTITTIEQMFAMRNHHTLVEHIAKILLYPKQLVAPRTWITPRRSG